MVKASRFVPRLLRVWLLSNAVMLPLIGAAVALAFGWALMDVAGLAAFINLSLLVAVVAAVHRWFAAEPGLLERASLSLEEDDAGVSGLPLLQLERRFRAHGDADAASLAATLRRLRDRLDRGVSGDGFEVPATLASPAERLDAASFRALERSARIHELVGELHTADFRARMEETRRELMAEVVAGVDALGTMLDHLQTADLRRAVEGELPAVREELDAGLAVAEAVEARMVSLEATLRAPAERV